MNRSHQDMDIAKRLKVIDWLKTEIIEQVSRLFKGLLSGSEEKIKDSLASLIVSSYVMGRRLGLSYRTLDEAVLAKLKEHREQGHQVEDWYGDLSAMEDYFNKR
jgi:hypothetical protein